MPYADPEKQREANRDSMRRARERKRREGWQKVSLPPKLVHKLDALKTVSKHLAKIEILSRSNTRGFYQKPAAPAV